MSRADHSVEPCFRLRPSTVKSSALFFDKIRDKIYMGDYIHLSVMDAGGNRISSTIASKLDFLMRLTNTQNNMLGKALSFDASYISRLRTGKRNLTRQRDVITPMAQYFARSARESYQRRVLAQRICPGEDWPASLAEGERLIAERLPAVQYGLRGDPEKDGQKRAGRCGGLAALLRRR